MPHQALRSAATATDLRLASPSAAPRVIDWEPLAKALEGELVLPGNPRYHTGRKLFNLAFEPLPLAVAFCVSEADAAAALAFFKEREIPFVIRSGGHTSAGYSCVDGRATLDVRALNGLTIDAPNKRARVGTGVSFDQLNKALGAHSLHLPGGECDSVCIGGFTQGGGFGFTSRTFGMNCDSALSMRVLLADGSLVEASPDSHPDLFWALRGGTGGNFGVLLSVDFALQALPELCGWAIGWPLGTEAERADGAQALMALQEGFMREGAPKEMNSQVMICFQDPQDNFARQIPWLLIRGAYIGAAAEAERLLAPLLGSPGAQRHYIRMGSYPEINAALLALPTRVPQFPVVIGKPKQRKIARVIERDLTLAQWRGWLDLFATCPNRLSYMCMEIYGGAINEPAPEATAFVHRRAAFTATLGVFWTDRHDQPDAMRMFEAWRDYAEPLWDGHIYQNYPSPDAPDFRSNYWGSNYPRLEAIKAHYDPGNLFNFEQSIRPRDEEAA